MRYGNRVPSAGENDAGDVSVQRLKKSKLAFIKCKVDDVATQTERLDLIHLIGIYAQRIQRLVQRFRLPRRRFGREPLAVSQRNSRPHTSTRSRRPHRGK